MTQIPEFVGELNFIVSYVYSGCRTPVTLFCQTAQPVAGRVALILLGFDWQDIVTAFFRPKGLRAARHGRKGRKGHHPKGVPQIPDLIAERIPAVDDFLRFAKGGPTGFFWALESEIERITWEVAVIELTEDFVFKSLLGVMKLEATHCDIPGRGFVNGHEYNPFNNGQNYALPFQNTDYIEEPCYKGDFSIAAGGDGTYQLIVNVAVKSLADVVGDCVISVEIAADVGGGVYENDLGSIEPGGYREVSGAWIIKAPCYVNIYQRSHKKIEFPAHDMLLVPSLFKATND